MQFYFATPAYDRFGTSGTSYVDLLLAGGAMRSTLALGRHYLNRSGVKCWSTEFKKSNLHCLTDCALGSYRDHS
jgi:hypothetical protein